MNKTVLIYNKGVVFSVLLTGMMKGRKEKSLKMENYLRVMEKVEVMNQKLSKKL